MNTIGRGGTYLLNIGLDGKGRTPPQVAKYLAKAGDWIRRYPEVVYGAGPSPWGQALPWGDVTTQGKVLNLTVFDWPADGRLCLPGLKTPIAAAAVSILTTFGIVISVLVPSLEFFAEIPITEFLFTTTWTPLFADPQYGVLPLIMGPMVITAIAVLIAIPLGLGSAIYLSEYAKPKARKILKPTLEVLAGIPTVVFGFFALEFITVFVLKPIFPGIQVFNALSAGIVMGIMIIPTIASLSEDAMASRRDCSPT